MDDGDAGERKDNCGSSHQGIVVEIPCKGQSWKCGMNDRRHFVM